MVATKEDTQREDEDTPRIARLLDRLSHLEEFTKDLERRVHLFNVRFFGFPDTLEMPKERSTLLSDDDLLSHILRSTQEIIETIHTISMDVDAMNQELPQSEVKT